MGRREVKREILALLGQPDLPAILLKIESFKEQELISPLFSALCSTEDMVRWHAVSTFGRVVGRMARRDIESARVVMRRFLWSLNDESGGIGWGAPEAMAEIMFHSESLAEEYLHLLISYTREDGPEAFQDGNFLELPMLQRGLLWGIGRLIPRYRKGMEKLGVAEDLRQYLLSPDKDVRGQAARCIGLLGLGRSMPEFVALSNDRNTFGVYTEEGITILTIAELVRSSLDAHGEKQ